MKRGIIFLILIQVSLIQYGQIIADHTIVDEYDKIPQEYIDSIKKMLVHVAGMSHAIGYQNGANLLELLDATYQVTTYSATPIPTDTDQYLRIGKTGLAGAGTWSQAIWRESVCTSFDAQNETGNPYDVFLYAPCWEMTWVNEPGGTEDPVYKVHWGGADGEGHIYGLDSGDEVLTGNAVCMDSYLAAVEYWNSYFIANDIPTITVFTTGPVDMNSGTENGFQRELKNRHIREYVAAHPSAILFDYADILVYNNSGVAYTVNWNDGGTLRPHQQIHPDNLLNYNSTWNAGAYPHEGEEDHIGEVGSLRVAKAMWWLLARIAGWNGK